MTIEGVENACKYETKNIDQKITTIYLNLNLNFLFSTKMSTPAKNYSVRCVKYIINCETEELLCLT